MTAGLEYVASLQPQDLVETALAVQMHATHTAAMELLSRGVYFPNDLNHVSANLAIKLLRTHTAQIEALARYRGGFRPSPQLQEPYAMVGVNVVAADTDEEARQLFTSTQVASVNMLRGLHEPMGPPIEDMETYWTPQEKHAVEHKLRYSFVGGLDTVRQGLTALFEETAADEVMTTVRVFDPAAGLHSLDILAQVRDGLTSAC